MMRVPARFLVATLFLLAGVAVFVFWRHARLSAPSTAAVAKSAPPARLTGDSPGRDAASSLAVVSKSAEPTAKRGRTATDLRPFELRARHESSFVTVSDIYGGFVTSAALTETEAKAFLELVCDERLTALDAVLIAREKGISYHDDPELEKLTLAAATARDGDIRQLLGAERYAQFEEYRATVMVRTTIELINERSTDAGEPLTDAQVKQLTQTYLAQQGPENTRRAPIKAVLQLIGLPVTDTMIEALRSILSSKQIAALIAVQAVQRTTNTATVGTAPTTPHP